MTNETNKEKSILKELITTAFEKIGLKQGDIITPKKWGQIIDLMNREHEILPKPDTTKPEN